MTCGSSTATSETRRPPTGARGRRRGRPPGRRRRRRTVDVRDRALRSRRTRWRRPPSSSSSLAATARAGSSSPPRCRSTVRASTTARTTGASRPVRGRGAARSRGSGSVTARPAAGAAPDPTRESKPLIPTSIYAITKRDHEELCLVIGARLRHPDGGAALLQRLRPGPGAVQPVYGRGRDLRLAADERPAAADLRGRPAVARLRPRQRHRHAGSSARSSRGPRDRPSTSARAGRRASRRSPSLLADGLGVEIEPESPGRSARATSATASPTRRWRARRSASRPGCRWPRDGEPARGVRGPGGRRPGRFGHPPSRRPRPDPLSTHSELRIDPVPAPLAGGPQPPPAWSTRPLADRGRLAITQTGASPGISRSGTTRDPAADPPVPSPPLGGRECLPSARSPLAPGNAQTRLRRRAAGRALAPPASHRNLSPSPLSALIGLGAGALGEPRLHRQRLLRQLRQRRRRRNPVQRKLHRRRQRRVGPSRDAQPHQRHPPFTPSRHWPPGAASSSPTPPAPTTSPPEATRCHFNTTGESPTSPPETARCSPTPPAATTSPPAAQAGRQHDRVSYNVANGGLALQDQHDRRPQHRQRRRGAASQHDRRRQRRHRRRHPAREHHRPRATPPPGSAPCSPQHHRRRQRRHRRRRAALRHHRLNSNVALGSGAGQNLTTGSNNIDIGNDGQAGEQKVIRIGTKGDQTRHRHRRDQRQDGQRDRPAGRRQRPGAVGDRERCEVERRRAAPAPPTPDSWWTRSSASSTRSRASRARSSASSPPPPPPPPDRAPLALPREGRLIVPRRPISVNRVASSRRAGSARRARSARAA